MHRFSFLFAGRIGLFTLSVWLMLFLNISAITAQEFTIDFGRSAPELTVLESNMQKLSLHLSYRGLNTLVVENNRGELFNEIFLPGAYAVGEVGDPKLPATKKLMEIPFGANVKVIVKSFSENEYNLKDYGIQYPLMPVQYSIRKDQDINEVPFMFNQNTYQRDEFIKHELASVEILGVLRGYRIARLIVAPVQYNPVKGTIRVFNDIDVEIQFENADETLTDYIKASTYSPYFEVIGAQLINNLRQGYPNHPDLTKYPVKYLIVSHRMFENDLQPFIQWKTKKGFKVIVAYTDVIGQTYAQIQSWIHAQYNSGTPTDPAPSFVLLVGDTPQLPSSLGSATNKMTDLYYASVDGDYFPEMYYGRFSATNSAQLVSQIAKTLYYEQYQFADPTYLNGVTLIAGADATWNPRVGQPTVLYGTNNYFNAAHGYTNVYPYLTAPYTGCYNPEKIAVSMINYTAHCNETSWGDPNLTIPMVNAFVNNGKYPIAIGNCCLAADFGYSECIGEVWQRVANKGSVAYIGSSPSSYWFEDFYWAVGAFPIQGTNNGYVPTYNETTWGAYDAPFVSNYVCVDALNFVGNLAVTTVHQNNWPSHSSPLYYWQAYNVLGDPSLIPYHTAGTPNTVSHLPILPIGLDYFEVMAEPGSYVGISKDGVLHGCALVDQSGIVQVPIQPVLSGGNVDIVVTKPQRIPYMVQIPAAALAGPYVVLDGYTINDASGNNNGLADYGENIALNVTLKNVGSDPAAFVTATLSGTDQYVTLTSTPTVNFGYIAAGATSTVFNAYSFSIANFVPNQHKAMFTLSITDGSAVWTSTLMITIQAPVLQIPAEFMVLDPQGNNNGILDPGETASIKMTIKNTGNSAISNVNINITSTDPMLTINTPVVNVPSINAGGTQEFTFNVSASASSPVGYSVNTNLSAAGGPQGLYTATRTITVVIGLIPEYFMSNQTVTTCVGYFYDTGGPNGNYQNNENLVMTFLPLSQDAIIKVQFVSFETELNYDYLYIYNGPNTSAPQVMGSPFHGTNSPGTVVGLNGSGALTFKFTSDGSIVKPGWVANVSCHYITGLPECASNPNPANNAQNVSLSKVLTWQSFDATTFDVYFGVIPNPPFVETVTVPQYVPSLSPNTTYYWKVVPKNNNGQAQNCPVWTFTTSGPEYLMSNATVTVNNGMFYDSGGPNGNYSNGENYTMTFLPSVPGAKLKFTFQSFNTEANYDFLHIYNGPNTNSPPFPGSPFHGNTTSPGTITSTHETGAITFKFISDNSITRPGWVANFMLSGTLSCNPTATPGEICVGGYSMLQANPFGGSGNYTFSWSPPESLSNPNAANPIATPTQTTVYTVVVNDGTSTVSGSCTVVVHPLPPVNLGPDITACANETVLLDATTPNAVSYLWTPGGYTTPTIMVDSTGVGYGSVTYTCQVTDIHGCVASDDVTVTFVSCATITENTGKFTLTVYPNPVKTSLNLHLEGDLRNVQVSLLNYHGYPIFDQYPGAFAGSWNYQINMADYPPGIYYLRIKSNEEVLIRKIVRQ